MAVACGIALTSCGTVAHAVSGSSSGSPHAAPTAAPGRTISAAGPGCGKQPLTAPGTTTVATLRVGGIVRTYWLHVPRGYIATKLTPLLLSFHGHGSTGPTQQAITGFSSLADHNGFLVLYPQGTIGPDGMTGWATGPRNDPKVNDLGFVAALLTHTESEVCVDPTRIYASGFSNGGAMTALLACDMATRIAAFASVSGSYFPLSTGCHPGRAVPLLEIHGTADSIVPYMGSLTKHLPAIPTWLAGWAARDGCNSEPTVLLHTASQITESWASCAGDGIVVHYARLGGRHVWPETLYAPGAAHPMSTAELIWSFCSGYTLRPGSGNATTKAGIQHTVAPHESRQPTVATPLFPLAVLRHE